VLITGLIGFYTLQLADERDRLAQERATADEVSNFLVNLFGDANPSQTRPDVTARQVLDEGAAGIEDCAIASRSWRRDSVSMARVIGRWQYGRPRIARRVTDPSPNARRGHPDGRSPALSRRGAG
jgi:hypothetical protein